jgi:hypothetical protein
MPFQIDNDTLSNDVFGVRESGSGDFEVEHKSTGALFRFDSSEGGWTFSGNGLGTQANSLAGIETDALTVQGWDRIDVTQRGVDNTGSSDAAADIESLIEADRTLILPEGTYRFDDTVSVDSNCAIIGHGDVTLQIETARAFDPGSQSTPLERFVLANVNVTNPNNSLQRFAAAAVAEDGRHVYDNITIEDQLADTGDAGAFRLDAADNAKALVHNFTATQGAPAGSSSGGFLMYPDGRGCLIRVQNSNIQNFYDNGIYGSNGGGITSGYSGEGRLEVINTVSKNNRVSQLRANGVNCLFDGCYAAVDSDAIHGTFTADLLKMREGDQHLVQNCRLRANNADASGRLINKEETCGAVKVTNCVLEDVGSDYEVNEEARNHARTSQFVIEDSTITSTGGALAGTFIRLANPGSQIRGCRISLDSAVTGVAMSSEYTKISDCIIIGDASNAIRIFSPYTSVTGNPFIGTTDTYSIRITDNTGDVRIADNTIQEFAIRNDAGNTVIERDNWVVTSQPALD